MIGRGALFTALRDRMLASTPIGSQATFNNRTNVAEWIRTGTYLVKNCTRSVVTLHISHVDFAVASLSEAENLLNHCLEHLQELACKQSDKRTRSEAWAVVTAYYLGFFSASALLHLIGEPIIFLTRQELTVPQKIAASPTGPSQGTYAFTLGPVVSATYTELTFKQTQKIHEATWKRVLGLMDTLRKDPTIGMQPDEADFYDSLCSQAFSSYGIGYDWPSFTRNQANYQAGFAYRLHKPIFSMNKFLDIWKLGTLDEVYAIFRGVYLRCSADRKQFSSHVEMMTNVSLALYLIVRELYNDLANRRLTDRRWEEQRRYYRQKLALSENEFATFRT
jgi:hypothetical protein